MDRSGRQQSSPSRTTSQTQVVFVCLDPLLQRLLQLVTKYRALVEASTQEKVVGDQELFQVIQAQVEVLGNVQRAIEQLGRAHTPSLILLVEYISLPLTVIFHIDVPRINLDDVNGQQRWLIQASSIRELYLAATKTVQAYLEACYEIPSKEPLLPSVSLHSKYLIQYLIALNKVFPSPSDAESLPQSTMDDGGDLWIALLQTIVTILEVCDNNAVAEAWEGTLVTRLVDCSLSLCSFSKNQAVSLQALKMIGSILRAAPEPSLWQSIFPGVLAALYRVLVGLHRRISSGLSVQIECQTLAVLGEVFRVALKPLKGDDKKPNSRSAVALLLQLESTAKKTHQSQGEEQSGKPGFVTLIQTRAVAPISVLLRQEVISPSASVRTQVVDFCEVLLMETRECWKGTTIEELCLEICLTLELDKEKTVATRAAAVLEDYTAHSSGTETYLMVSRILALVQELPVLVQGSKTVELRMQIQLLTGYLRAVGSSASPALAASKSMRRALIQFMDVDLNSVSSMVVATSVDEQKSSELRLRFLNADIESLSRRMLRTLGKTLGVKHSALVVDAFVSDFHETSKEQVPTCNTFCVEWLHEWIGSLAVAKEILIGAFSVEEENVDVGSKKEKRRRRLLQSLGSSILPLLVDSPFLMVSRTIIAEAEKIDNRPSSNYSRSSPEQELGRACICVLFLEFVTDFCELLKGDIHKFRSTILYPIIENMNNTANPTVQRVAHTCVMSIAGSSGVFNLNDFIRQEFHLLMAYMMGRLRLPSGAQLPQGSDVEAIHSVSASLRWILEAVVRANTELGRDQSSLSSMIDLTTLLIERYDHLILRKVVREDMVYHLTFVHKAGFEYLLHYFGANDGVDYTYHMKKTPARSNPSWIGLLSSFFKEPSPGFEGQLGEEKKRGGAEEPIACSYFTTTEIDFVSMLIFRDLYRLANQSLRVKIATCDSLTSGFRFLAFVACTSEPPADEENNIRNSILRQVATSWPSIKARVVSVSGAILVSSGARSLFMTRTSPAEANTSSAPTVATQRIFLAKLFTLVAVLCECSGDFMANRFKNDVWPEIARQLGQILEERARRRGQLLESRLEKKLVVTPSHTRNHYKLSVGQSSWSDSERLLTLAILKCALRVLRQEECGPALSSILGAAGAMILPFLDDDDAAILSCTMETLRTIAYFDCDVLLRPLLHLTGRGIPRCSLKASRNNSSIVNHNVASHNSLEVASLAMRCQELLAYIESLPEQSL